MMMNCRQSKRFQQKRRTENTGRLVNFQVGSARCAAPMTGCAAAQPYQIQ